MSKPFFTALKFQKLGAGREHSLFGNRVKLKDYQEALARVDALTAERDALAARCKRLETALQLIADQTICPEAFPNEDINGDSLQAKTALMIAMAAIESQP